MIRCPHDDDPYLCATCNAPKPREVVAARQSDECAECWEPIEPGDPIARRHGDLAWVHDECR